MTREERMNEIADCGRRIAAWAGIPDDNPVKLAKRIHRIERAVHRAAERICSIPMDDAEGYQDMVEKTADKGLRRILGDEAALKVKLNWDPRGYALKVESGDAGSLTRDWGGFGILCPEIE